MKILLIAGAAIAGICLFLLATASAKTDFEKYYPPLLALNAFLVVILAAIVATQLIALRRRIRARLFGSQLALRFLVLLAAMAVVPGVLVYVVSVQFLTKSIESWFDVKVESALTGGISIGQGAIDQMLVEMQLKGRAMALELAPLTGTQQVVVLDRLREQAGIPEAVLLSARGGVVASAGETLAPLVPELPDPGTLRGARSGRAVTHVDGRPGRPIVLRVILPVGAATISEELRLLQLRQALPESFSRSAEAVEIAYREYRELTLSRQGLRWAYVVTLTLALLLALLIAVALAAVIANKLAEPLANLANATHAVARGDFARRAPVTSQDELGMLTESFNSMTRRLGETQEVLERQRLALETSNAYLESILANLSAGVLVFDRQLHLTVFNRGAATTLGEDLPTLKGKPLTSWGGALLPLAAAIQDSFDRTNDAVWQIQLSVNDRSTTLLVRDAVLPENVGGGHVLVFDDVTQLIHAQRATAWTEMAKRLAHEIKNPLTPIQLAAERLEMKLADRLGREEAATLKRSTQTIVTQVSALKTMVDDFREYAQLPAPARRRVDLNALIADVVALYEQSGVYIRCDLERDLPDAHADAAQVRQVLHNLIQNSQDALAKSDLPEITIATSRVGACVRLWVSDNGTGFREDLLARIFEPYVTSKPRGTGLGLAIVKKIIDEHRGTITIQSRPRSGATVQIDIPVYEERAVPARAA